MSVEHGGGGVQQAAGECEFVEVQCGFDCGRNAING